MEYSLGASVRWSLVLVLFLSGVNGAAVLTGPVNVTALVGSSASFFCAVSGTQDVGQDLQFYRTEPSPSVLLGLNSNLRNESRYNVSGTYTYTIKSVLVEDEGKYDCVLFPTTYAAYLTVNAAPETMTLSWPGGSSTVQKGTPSNLTCTTERSRPPATHRWFKGSNELTNQATQVVGTADSSGYGTTVSYIVMTLQDADYYAPLHCVADLAGSPSVQTAELRVSFSSGKAMAGNAVSIMLSIFAFLCTKRYVL